MSQTPGAPQITGKLFLFERPELLNKEQHGNLGITAPESPCSFCANVAAIPLTASEIPAAVKDYPVVFLSEEEPIPLAVVGLIDETNLFVDENGNWEPNTYIPGYVRRYPFAIANESEGDRLAIVLDTAFSGVVPGGETLLFDNGEPTEATQQAIEFCKAYEGDRRMTEQFMQLVKNSGLVRGQAAQYTPKGETNPKPFAQYFGIDENGLSDLDDQKFLEIRKSNILPFLYAQLMSLGNWRTLLMRRAKRFNLTEDQVFQQITKN